MLDTIYSDVELLELARQGNIFAEDELIKRYSKIVRICARPFFLAGGDSEDLIQEGMLGLLNAIRKYDLKNNASFKTFAEHCIRNRILSAVEAAGRQKHSPLNDRISLEDIERNPQSNFSGIHEDPFYRQTENFVLEKTKTEQFFHQYNERFSDFERTVLELYLTGMSYREIAVQLGTNVKSIDNAVQRIRKKCAK